MCVHNENTANQKEAEKNAKEQEQSSINAEITKMSALRNSFSNCIDKMKCVENELSDMSVVDGKPYDNGISAENISKMKLEDENWGDAIKSATKFVNELAVEIDQLTKEINNLRGSDCFSCMAAFAEATAATTSRRK